MPDRVSRFAAGGLLVLAATIGASPASAAVVSTRAHIGFATTYTQQWQPGGNCGVSKRLLDVRYYAALNYTTSTPR